MLSKVFKNLFSTAPQVWVNKDTKVICQGITGNQVLFHPLRVPSKLNKHSPIILKWLEESTQKKQEPLISVSLSSKTAQKPKRTQVVMHLSSMFHLQEQQML